MFSATDAASAAGAQVQAASATKALEASKQEGEAAVSIIQTATEGAEIGSAPNATGNVIDVKA